VNQLNPSSKNDEFNNNNYKNNDNVTDDNVNEFINIWDEQHFNTQTDNEKIKSFNYVVKYMNNKANNNSVKVKEFLS